MPRRNLTKILNPELLLSVLILLLVGGVGFWWLFLRSDPSQEVLSDPGQTRLEEHSADVSPAAPTTEEIERRLVPPAAPQAPRTSSNQPDLTSETDPSISPESAADQVEVPLPPTPSSKPQNSVSNPDPDSDSAVSSLVWQSEFFPNLVLNYPASWELQETNLPSEFAGLDDYEITLTRDAAEFRVYLYPLRAGGCTGEPTAETPLDYISANGFQEFQISAQTTAAPLLQYDEGIPECKYDTLIQSSVEVAPLTELNNQNAAWVMDTFNLNQAQYILVLEARVPELSSPALAQIREIVANSSFN